MKTTTPIVAVFVLFMALSSMPQTDAQFKDCWEAWSRCSRWSSWLTGKLWKSCNDRCKELGYSGGNCVEVSSPCPLTDSALQCQCYGSGGGATPGTPGSPGTLGSPGTPGSPGAG